MLKSFSVVLLIFIFQLGCSSIFIQSERLENSLQSECYELVTIRDTAWINNLEILEGLDFHPDSMRFQFNLPTPAYEIVKMNSDAFLLGVKEKIKLKQTEQLFRVNDTLGYFAPVGFRISEKMTHLIFVMKSKGDQSTIEYKPFAIIKIKENCKEINIYYRDLNKVLLPTTYDVYFFNEKKVVKLRKIGILP
ncbi:MAG: hypothetical protein SFU91_05410 [Chloroherpetonaceae bacterium]|nr:hypothetical protein [Chloroherpetonaceae bacterium]